MGIGGILGKQTQFHRCKAGREEMKIGDMIYPKPRHHRSGQLHLPFWGNDPALIIDLVHYETRDENDCQSDGMEDMRWLILEGGELLYMTTFLLEQLYESR